MARRVKKRAFTDSERDEVYRIRYNGRLGRVAPGQNERAGALFKINPDEYVEIGEKARADADETVTS